MRRLTLLEVILLTTALTGAACSGDSTTTPTTPTPTATTENFSGTLLLNGALTFPFVVSQQGAAVATLKALNPTLSFNMASGGTGDFAVGETVFQGASIDTATASAVVSAWNPATGVLWVIGNTGSLTVSAPLIGATSGAQWTLDTFDTPSVSIALGTWSGTVCSILLANDNAAAGSEIDGVAQGQGSLCARISDIGHITIPSTFSLDVTHY